MASPKVTLLTGLLAVTLTLSACGKNGAFNPSAGEKVATVDGIVITKGQYDKLFDQVKSAYNLEANPEALKNPLLQESIKRMVLQKLIMTALLEHDAQTLGVTVTPDEIKKLKDERIKDFGTADMFNKFLSESKISPEEFDEKLKEQLLVNKFIEKKGGESLKVTDKEAEEYYKSHKTDFSVPESIHASHILVKALDPEIKREIRKTNPKFTEDEVNAELKKRKAAMKAKAENLLAQVQMSPTQFATLANKNSDDTVSARNGGDLDQLYEANTEKTFWEAIKKTRPGTLYPKVLETPFGYHVILVKDHAKAHDQSFQEAKMKIVTQIAQEKKASLMNTWATEKMAGLKPEDIEPAYRPQDPQKMQQQAAGSEGGAPPAQ